MITFVQIILIIIGIGSGASGFDQFDVDKVNGRATIGAACFVVAFLALGGVVALELLVKR